MILVEPTFPEKCRHSGALTFVGSPVPGGKKHHHEGHEVHKGESKLILQVFFLRDVCVTSTSSVQAFVVEKGFPVKNGRPLFLSEFGLRMHE